MHAKVPYLSIEKEKENVCAKFTNSIEREGEFLSSMLEEREHDARATCFFC